MKNILRVLKTVIILAGLQFSNPSYPSDLENRVENLVVKSTIAPRDEWEKFIPYSGTMKDIESVSDGAVVVGYNYAYGRGSSRFMKFYSKGGLAFDKDVPELIVDVTPTFDGKYIFTGQNVSGNYKIYLAKKDESGEPIFERSFAINNYDMGKKVLETPDSFFISGTTEYHEDLGGGTGLIQNKDFFLIKTNKTGMEQWRKVYTFNKYDTCFDCVQTSDDGFLLVGASDFGSQNGRNNICFFKTNSDGVFEWVGFSGGSEQDYARSVDVADDGYIIAGDMGAKSFLLKTDLSGNLIWQKNYSYSGTTKGNKVRKDSDGGYFLLGDTVIGGSQKGYLLKTDSSGNGLWSYTFTDDKNVIPSSFFSTEDEFFITGVVPSGSIFYNNEAYVSKLRFGPPDENPPVITTEPIEPGKNLVIVTHGWNDSGKNNWPEYLSDSIKQNIFQDLNSDDWNSFFYDWSTDASFFESPSPSYAIPKAKLHGTYLGGKIVDAGYESVHFIAHSAGAWLINEAAKEIKRQKPETRIHLTFLDPYVKLNDDSNLASPNYSDWAENFFIADSTGILTGRNFRNTYNIDLEKICTNSVENHGFPVDWYFESVTSHTLERGTSNFGFVRSYEGGGQSAWYESLVLGRGNDSVNLENNFLSSSVISDNLLNVSDGISLSPQDNGIVVSLNDSSPKLKNTGELSVWFESRCPLPQNTEYISLSHRFENSNPGRVSVYFNNNIISLSDFNLHGNRTIETGELSLDSLIQSENFLGVRIDGDSSSFPSVYISNPKFGNFSVRTSAKNWRLFN